MPRVETNTLLNLGSILHVCGQLTHVSQSSLIFIKTPLEFGGEGLKF